MPVTILLAEDRVGKDIKFTMCSGLVDLGGQPSTHTVARLPARPTATGESKNNKNKKHAGLR